MACKCEIHSGIPICVDKASFYEYCSRFDTHPSILTAQTVRIFSYSLVHAPLPEYWRERECQGMIYFYHEHHRISSWIHPVDYVLQSVLPIAFDRTMSLAPTSISSVPLDVSDEKWKRTVITQMMVEFDDDIVQGALNVLIDMASSRPVLTQDGIVGCSKMPPFRPFPRETQRRLSMCPQVQAR